MKLKLITEYENINQEWLDWYLDRLATKGTEETKLVAMSLRAGQVEVGFSSKNEDVIATTTYKLER